MGSKKGLIIDAARKIFSRKGYDGTRVDEIALGSRVNKATIYYYFKGKDELYKNALSSSVSRVLASLRREINEEMNPRDAIGIYIKAFYEHAKEDDAFLKMLIREVADGGIHMSEEVVKIFIDILSILENILNKGFKEGVFRKVNTKMVHFSVIGAISFYLCSFGIREKFKGEVKAISSFVEDGEHDIEELQEIIIRGLEK